MHRTEPADSVSAYEAATAALIDLVNPLQGTNTHHGFSTGNTLPLIAAPWGMTHWAPQTRESNAGWFFHPDDHKFEGIRATHQPSPWMGDYGHFVVMPQTGSLKLRGNSRAVAYDTKSAVFSPSYFRAELTGNDCLVEFVPTSRCAVMRVGFAQHAAIDPVSAALPRRILLVPGAGGTRVEISADRRTMRGWTRANNGGVPDNYAFYFVAVFDTPFTEWGFGASDGRVFPRSLQAEGDQVGGYVEFATGDSASSVEVRIATSFISLEQAERNLEQEVGQRTFDELKTTGAEMWEAELSRLVVAGGTDAQRVTLYSCLYRTMLFPRDFHEFDASGAAVHYSPYDGKVHPGKMVTDNGFWDTYRTVYPLYSLVCPERLSDVLAGWLPAYRESGWLPTWASPGHRLCMIGTHTDVIFADAIAKGIGGFDIHEVYEALRKHAFVVVNDDTGFGRLGLEAYMKLGYVPDDKIHHASASRTVDYAYNDYCVAQVARAAGHLDEAEVLEKRALYWRNVFDSSVGMLRGRNSDGSWRVPWDEFEWGGPFIEGGTWQHSWSAPHDPAGLIAVDGGAESFVAKLEKMLALPGHFRVGSYGVEIHEMTEMAAATDFGQYAHSNQPVHHILYLFACAGRPDLTQHWVRRVLNELYSTATLPGDEDNGEMAGWYVFSAALGLYPLCPGNPTYVFGSPLFPETALALPGGKSLIVRAIAPAGKTIEESPYVASITWNGEPWTRLSIEHSILVAGGELCFTLSDVAPERRDYPTAELPYSLTRYAAR